MDISIFVVMRYLSLKVLSSKEVCKYMVATFRESGTSDYYLIPKMKK